jgi:hypothetical protein
MHHISVTKVTQAVFYRRSWRFLIEQQPRQSPRSGKIDEMMAQSEARISH